MWVKNTVFPTCYQHVLLENDNNNAWLTNIKYICSKHELGIPSHIFFWKRKCVKRPVNNTVVNLFSGDRLASKWLCILVLAGELIAKQSACRTTFFGWLACGLPFFWGVCTFVRDCCFLQAYQLHFYCGYMIVILYRSKKKKEKVCDKDPSQCLPYHIPHQLSLAVFMMFFSEIYQRRCKLLH